MKQLILLSLFVIFLTSISFAAITTNAVDIRVNTLKYEPYPAEPGKYIQLWLNIENYGLQSAEKVTFVLEPEYPFSIDGNATKYFGEIRSLENVVIDYKVRVASNAVEGWNELILKHRVGDSDVWITNTINIYVQTPDAIISVENVKTMPEQIAPGSKAAVSIKLKNLADSDLKDITIKLNLTGTVFAPIESISEKRIYLLSAGSEEDITFNIIAEADADSKLYKVPITISYNDAVGTNYTKSDVITLTVGDEPNITTNIESSTILTAMETGTVTINIINKGLIGIKFLTVKLNQTSNYEILSASNEVYIGNLDVDDYETVEYKIFVNENADSIILPLQLEYRDDNNKLFTEQKNLKLKLYTAEEITKLGLRTTDSTLSIIGFLVLIVILYFGYKRLRRRK